ncbi:MAG TPA: glucan biosynthesis protein G [Candidatus Binatia bacterium]
MSRSRSGGRDGQDCLRSRHVHIPIRQPGSTMVRLAIVAATLAALTLAAGRAAAFDFDDVSAKAKALATQPFQEPVATVPDWLAKLSYDQWRDIRFRSEHALWRDRELPFEVQFFHPGLYYDRIVTISEVDATGAHVIPFSPSLFDYGKNDIASRVPQDLGFAGFRVHYPIKSPAYKDEVIVFLGATYFRAIGKDQGFGLSARGLAIDTAAPSGEEFPWFKEFWLVRPAKGATSMEIWALLDSPSMAGAYRFVLYPGTQTVIDVEAKLFRRREVAKLGIGALTSMFLFGENTTRCFDNYRPEVHDSDGLLLFSDTGEWLWRPLDNPETLQVHSYQMTNPRGFGLLQRDRDFRDYQDLETLAEKRPSAWITPKGPWGPGRVELVEIPTDKDIHDNINVYWVPDKLPPLAEPVTFAFRMNAYGEDPTRPPAGRATATRRERGTNAGTYRFVVDFEGRQLEKIPADDVLRAVVSVAGGDEKARIVAQYVIKMPTGGWRLGFEVEPESKGPLELRAYLDKAGSALTETWSYSLVQ